MSKIRSPYRCSLCNWRHHILQGFRGIDNGIGSASADIGDWQVHEVGGRVLGQYYTTPGVVSCGSKA